MRILCVGISHKTAGVAMRERLAFDQAARPLALAELAERWDRGQFAILSTCNRTEIYTARALHGHPRSHELVQWLAARAALGVEDLAGAVYTLTDDEAVHHLLAVAAGLDSLVVGEAQIAAQVKDAYAVAGRAGVAGATLNILFQSAMAAGKRVRSETTIGSSGRSVASLAIDCATRSLGGLAGKAVLNVGAGKMSGLMVRRLAEMGAGPVTVANRSRRRAETLAEKFAGRAVGLDQLARHLAEADVVVASAACDSPVITAPMVAEAMAGRAGRPMLIVDLAVPRNVDPAVGGVANVRLYDIDDLERLVAGTETPGADQHRAAEAIIDQEADAVLDALKIRSVGPTIEAMYRYVQQIAAAEFQTASNKLATHHDAEADRLILDRALRRTVRRILHPAVKNLRQASADGAAAVYVAALRKLFDLDGTDQ